MFITENEDTVSTETELLMSDDDSVCIVFREKEIVRDTAVETDWDTGESEFEIAMVFVDSVKVPVGKISDEIFSAEKDVLIIGVIDVNDVNGFWIDVLEPSLLPGCENETVRFFKGSPVEYVDMTRYEELVTRVVGVRSDTVAMLLSSNESDDI